MATDSWGGAELQGSGSLGEIQASRGLFRATGDVRGSSGSARNQSLRGEQALPATGEAPWPKIGLREGLWRMLSLTATTGRLLKHETELLAGKRPSEWSRRPKQHRSADGVDLVVGIIAESGVLAANTYPSWGLRNGNLSLRLLSLKLQVSRVLDVVLHGPVLVFDPSPDPLQTIGSQERVRAPSTHSPLSSPHLRRGSQPAFCNDFHNTNTSRSLSLNSTLYPDQSSARYRGKTAANPKASPLQA
ncbi:hypothetical protein B0J14DRAFT_564157 [Halenospora varia]|nr:hypothetical protein B0J14DRAFT_564157 [Halenospora varia]